MKSECRLAKANEPEIKYDFGGVMATFTGTSPAANENNNPADPEPVLVKLINPAKQAEKGSEKGSEKIIALIQSDTSVTIAAIAEKLNLTTRAIEKQLAKLQAQGIIHRIGPDKGGHWKVAKKDTW